MDRENKHLRFVLKYYRPGVFDTRRAVRVYRDDHPAGFTLWRRYAAGIAAAVALCVAGAYYLLTSGRDSMTVLYAHATAVSYLLPDSSTVTLYPNSTLSYSAKDFGEESRAVDMSGKVAFKVYRNPEAPFTVNASYSTVRVLGTQFTVDASAADSTSVTVSSGKVLFTARDKSEGVVLTKGMEAYLLADNSLPQLVQTVSDSPDGSASAVHRFVFDNTPLPEVLATLSAHFKVRLSCPAQGKMLTAEFETDNLDEIIMVIEKSLDVKIVKEAVK